MGWGQVCCSQNLLFLVFNNRTSCCVLLECSAEDATVDTKLKQQWRGEETAQMWWLLDASVCIQRHWWMGNENVSRRHPAFRGAIYRHVVFPSPLVNRLTRASHAPTSTGLYGDYSPSVTATYLPTQVCIDIASLSGCIYREDMVSLNLAVSQLPYPRVSL